MKLGILQCDSVLDEFQEQFGDYPDMFIQLFRSVRPDLEFVIYDIRKGELPTNLDECNAYLSTGSRESVYDKIPWLPAFKDFIRRLYQNKSKLIAVCFAHQLVADIFGGKAERSQRGWGVGVANDSVFRRQTWMNPPQQTIKLVVSHQDQVTKLPENAVLLAGNDFCPNYMYQIEQCILSIQGHPEFSKQYSQSLMEHRVSKIGESTYRKAIESLTLQTDEKIVARWILNFLEF